MKHASYLVLGIFLICTGVFSTPYQELVPEFNRIKSNAMVRKITVPTAANLDYSAYDRNPVLFEQQKKKPAKPGTPVTLESMTFGTLLSDICNTLAQTPLTDTEREAPLAWDPLSKKLWNVVKDPGIQEIAGKINGYKWADPGIYQPYQLLTTAYIHENKSGGVELWVKVEFSPWVDFIKAVDDEDRDGFKEIYGKLRLETIAPDSLAKAIAWVRNDYQRRILTQQEMVDWITELASYWYPTKNTDIIDMAGNDTWPNNDTRKIVLKTLKGLKVKNPLAVVEGKPFRPDRPIYNVYVVDAVSMPAENVGSTEKVTGNNAEKMIDTARSKNFSENDNRFREEEKKNGSYDAWAKKNSSFFDGLKKLIASLPPEQMGIQGKEDWLFFRKSFDYLLGGDLASQAKEKNPIPHLVDFKNYLNTRNVNLLFVVIPNKEEVYYEKLPAPVAVPGISYVNPYSRKFLKDAQAAGIEVIDVLPQFLAAKADDKKIGSEIYQHQDTHWSNRGLQIVATAIADRVKQYAWYPDLEKIEYGIIDTSFSRQGDIVDKMPELEKAKYKPVVLQAQQVRLPDGNLYKGDGTSPIMLIGDSFTGVFESVDCKSAGVGAHIAAKTGVPVDIITSWGGGPLVRKKAMRAREKDLPHKRLVVYLMVARDLYNYAMSWETFPEK